MKFIIGVIRLQALKIIVIGECWHGSDCTGLARGFRELGHAVELIGTDQFFPMSIGGVRDKILRRLLSPYCKGSFNEYVLGAIDRIRPDVVVVFKGNYVEPQTLDSALASGAWLCNFYPDVSAYGHPGLDVDIFSKFNHIFTTKTFGVNDFFDKFGLVDVSFLPHGFDPLVHRPIFSEEIEGEELIDVSFIGTWSPHKELLLGALEASSIKQNICIWGSQWEKSKNNEVRKSAQLYAITGDYYAQAIGKSKINLGLLSERRSGASTGDQITSRTFHIPASGGFMLHERTEEVLEYFEEGKEIACFDGESELVDKVAYYLNNEEERIAIAQAGYERCINENRLANRAESILEKYYATRV